VRTLFSKFTTRQYIPMGDSDLELSGVAPFVFLALPAFLLSMISSRFYPK